MLVVQIRFCCECFPFLESLSRCCGSWPLLDRGCRCPGRLGTVQRIDGLLLLLLPSILPVTVNFSLDSSRMNRLVDVLIWFCNALTLTIVNISGTHRSRDGQCGGGLWRACGHWHLPRPGDGLRRPGAALVLSATQGPGRCHVARLQRRRHQIAGW